MTLLPKFAEFRIFRREITSFRLTVTDFALQNPGRVMTRPYWDKFFSKQR